MMTMQQIAAASREELAEELGYAGEYTADWETVEIGDLRDRVTRLVEHYRDLAE
jgi:hypothetical protein